MKNLINVKRIVILTLLFVLGISTISFADVYGGFYVVDMFAIKTINIVGIAVVIGVALIVIDLICMIVGKIIKAKELVNKTKIIAEKLIYYTFVLFAIGAISVIATFAQIIALICFAEIIISLYFRLRYKNKKYSYIVLIATIMTTIAQIITY